jgi:excinuclease ABC subunit A
VRDVVLNGSGATEIAFRYTDSRGRAAKRAHPFEGILPNLERRYRETESSTVRDELGKYRGTRRCPDCDGARLSSTARHVHVAGTTLPEITRLSVAKAMQHYAQLQVAGWRGEVAARIVKEVADRLRFLVDVGLDYLTLDRSAETLSGGEAQRIRLASQVGSGLTGVLYILDEPSIGLHQRDNQRLLATLRACATWAIPCW